MPDPNSTACLLCAGVSLEEMDEHGCRGCGRGDISSLKETAAKNTKEIEDLISGQVEEMKALNG